MNVSPAPHRPHRAPHHIPRYAPVQRLLRELPPGARVLEVGSGSEGLATWWKHPFVGVDIKFEFRRPPNMLSVQGDAAHLPFADDTFDLVVCVAVLLHMEGVATVEAVCHEIGRVTRGKAVVVTPAGVPAHESDLRMLAWLRRSEIDIGQWFSDQVSRGALSPGVVKDALGEHGDVAEGTTVSVPWNERFFRVEQRLRRVRGAMTAMQPALRLWGAVAARELPGGGEPYERVFVLDTRATASPPRADS
jgi:SAM-dependent methyltransferase